jgi:hypothetical protein
MTKEQQLMITELLEHRDELNEWEQGFVDSIKNWNNLSIAQVESLEKTYERVFVGNDEESEEMEF